LRVGLLALCLPWATQTAAAAESEPGWQTLHEEGELRISARSVPGERIRELRVSAVSRWPAARLMALIGDLDNYPRFMPHTRHVQSLGRSGRSGRWYIVIDPMMVSRRDYCVRVTIERFPDGRLQSRFGGQAEGCPAERRGLVRMRRIEGSWTLYPRPDGRTLLVYQAITDPAGDVPTWMVNRAGASSLRDMLRALERAAGDPRVAPCPGPSLGCFGP